MVSIRFQRWVTLVVASALFSPALLALVEGFPVMFASDSPLRVAQCSSVWWLQFCSVVGSPVWWLRSCSLQFGGGFSVVAKALLSPLARDGDRCTMAHGGSRSLLVGLETHKMWILCCWRDSML